MPQKARSSTTSSKSNTNNPAEVPVQFVKGVGPGLGRVFESRGIQFVRDLLTFFPRAYQDRSKFSKVSELTDSQIATVGVQILESRRIPIRGGGRSILEVRCSDGSGTLSLKWFHAPKGMAERFKPGLQIIVTGTVKFFMQRPGMVHPEISWGASADAGSQSSEFGRIVPIYTEIEGVPSRVLRKILWEAVERYAGALSEDLPKDLLKRRGLPNLSEAIREIHFPHTNDPKLLEFGTPAQARLIYEEFFKFEYLMIRKRLRMEREFATTVELKRSQVNVSDLRDSLPFQLTHDQKQAISEILIDLSKPHPMSRLIQGDVGSGKTVVAFLTAAAVIADGGQVALMAPTEILAEQHYKNASRFFAAKLKVALLTGKTPKSERDRLFERLALGEPILLIGTHALIEDPVQFKNLAYVMIDEQHRFGVEQRRALRAKGSRPDPLTQKILRAHHLILTATPIPRTLALTAYGDLSVSTIREMPPGRSPVQTYVIRGEARTAAMQRIRNELQQGRQAYFIYPLVNDSEAEGFTSLKSAVSEADYLQNELFPEFKVGLLHGQMNPLEKAKIMDAFYQNQIQVLVSTTVVEVGVDVPNATIMAVEHSERFGLSQLHQLRGRVGRGQNQSYCYFFSAKKTAEATSLRLEVLEETHDGFKIAEADLEIRGPGEFLGVRQAGSLPFKIADLVRDKQWLLHAREDVEAILSLDPKLERPEHLALKNYFELEGRAQTERLKTS